MFVFLSPHLALERSNHPTYGRNKPNETNCMNMMLFPSRLFHLVGNRAIFAPSSGGGPLVPVQDREQEIHVRDEEQERRHPDLCMRSPPQHLQRECRQQPRDDREREDAQRDVHASTMPKYASRAQGEEAEVPREVLRRDDLVERHESERLDEEGEGQIAGGDAKARETEDERLRHEGDEAQVAGRRPERRRRRRRATPRRFPAASEVDPVPVHGVIVTVVETPEVIQQSLVERLPSVMAYRQLGQGPDGPHRNDEEPTGFFFGHFVNANFWEGPRLN